MSTLAIKFDDHAVGVNFTQTSLHFILADGREISAPLEWFPRLRDAKETDRNNWRFIGNGIGVHWPNIDEDIAISTLKLVKQGIEEAKSGDLHDLGSFANYLDEDGANTYP